MSLVLLEALQCRAQKRPPVWLMRQAGRCLPTYRVMRERYSLMHIFFTPELIAEVTQLPLEILGVDAAILFSDILMVVPLLGLQLTFAEGPCISPLIENEDDVNRLHLKDVEEVLHPIAEAIPLIKQEIDVPLIGLCGGPFTVASYLLDKSHKAWMQQAPDTFHKLLERLTQASIAFLTLQVRAGVEVVQIFDSWAHVLEGDDLRTFSLVYLQKIVDAMRLCNIPTILFSSGSSFEAEQFASLEPQAISFDWHRPIDHLRQQVHPHVAVQGNLDPAILKMPLSTIRKETTKMLESMRGAQGYIANLGHGVLPDTPVDHVKCFVDTVKAFI